MERTDARKEAETWTQRRIQSHDDLGPDRAQTRHSGRDKAHNWKDKGFPRKRRSKDWPEEDR